jgi:hypothetical protein
LDAGDPPTPCHSSRLRMVELPDIASGILNPSADLPSSPAVPLISRVTQSTTKPIAQIEKMQPLGVMKIIISQESGGTNENPFFNTNSFFKLGICIIMVKLRCFKTTIQVKLVIRFPIYFLSSITKR